MVTARDFASRSDASIAAELGSLLQFQTLIGSPRWSAVARGNLAPVLERFHLPSRGVAELVTPPKLLPRFERIVDGIPDDLTRGLVYMRSIRERSLRAGVGLRLVRMAIVRGDFAGAMAVVIEPAIYRQRGWLAIARGHFEAGDVTAALRIVRRARDRRLVAERQLLLAEIGLALRPTTEHVAVEVGHLRVAAPSPVWTQLAAEPEPAMHHQLLQAVVWMRRGLRWRLASIIERAVGHLIATRLPRPARRLFLAMLARSHVSVEDALLAMRTVTRGTVVESLFAEHVAMRAERLARVEVPAALRDGLTGRPAMTADARSLDRALFDEGQALSADAPRRRRVLIATAQTCLRSAAVDPTWNRDVIDARIRTLVHLGGTLAEQALDAALGCPELRPAALEALACVEPREAARVALAMPGDDFDRVLRLIEIRRGLPRGFAHAYRTAYDAIRDQHPDAAGWLRALVDAWRREAGTVPDPIALAQIADRKVIPRTPQHLTAQLDAAGAVILGDAHDRIIATVANNPGILDALLLARPPRLDPYMRAWDRARWTGLIARTAHRSDFVDRHTLAYCATRLGVSYDQLRVGEPPGAQLQTFTVEGRSYRLRRLDKRLDLLTYLRFADVATRNCFRTDRPYYTEKHIVDVWKDPLTTCFHIERERDGERVPCGFFFTGFADIRGRIGVVVNSLHVRPRTLAMRAATLRAFEDAFCAPLGIDRIGVANEHGGAGPLPATYALRAESVVRLRALGRDGLRVTRGYDDISCIFNRRITLGHLSWRA